MERQPNSHAARSAFEAAVVAALQRVELTEETPENARVWGQMVNAFIEFARRQSVRRADPTSFRGIKFERRGSPAGDSVSRVYRITVPLGHGAGVLEAYVAQPAVRLDFTGWGKVWADGRGCPVCLKRLSNAKKYADRKKRSTARRARGWAPLDLASPLVCAVGFLPEGAE